MVANRLRKNLKRLNGWRRRHDVTCFRAYDADLPEYAAAIDVYQEEGGHARRFLHVLDLESAMQSAWSGLAADPSSAPLVSAGG